MGTAAYVCPFVVAAIGTAASIGLMGGKEYLFPGLLALFSFCLMWTTVYSHAAARTSAAKRENPDLLIHKGSVGLLGDEDRRPVQIDKQGTGFLICVTHPGVLAGSLLGIEVHVPNGEKKGIEWSWQSLHPVLAPRPGTSPRSSLPAPLFPGGMLVVYPSTGGTTLPEGTKLEFSFQMANFAVKKHVWPSGS